MFILATVTKRANARGAFYGLIAGMVAVIASALTITSLAYLWYNLIGVVVSVSVGLAVSAMAPDVRADRAAI